MRYHAWPSGLKGQRVAYILSNQETTQKRPWQTILIFSIRSHEGVPIIGVLLKSLFPFVQSATVAYLGYKLNVELEAVFFRHFKMLCTI